MREILFRGKRIDNGEWVEGFLFYQKMDGIAVSCIGTEPIMANAFYEIGGEGIDWHEVDPSTICQYTGLTDKNGRKIWENEYEDADEAGLIAACHCGDCAHKEWIGKTMGSVYCPKTKAWRDADDFCKFAKRSDKEV